REVPVLLLVPRHGCDDSYAAPRSARSAPRGRNTGTVTSSEISWNRTSRGMPTSSASNSQSTTLVIMRGPSSRSTTAATYGTRSPNGGRSLRRTTDHVYKVARPLASTHSTLLLQHTGQNGRG